MVGGAKVPEGLVDHLLMKNLRASVIGENRRVRAIKTSNTVDMIILH